VDALVGALTAPSNTISFASIFLPDRSLLAHRREFSGKQGIQIAFLSEDVPAHISPDVTLCLFRIVQEALQNLKKHSGAEKAEVRLRKSSESCFSPCATKARASMQRK